jgi:ABC-type hemin transport system substrate-binding protein
MATIKQQKMIDSMFCRVDKEARLLVVAQEVQALSKEIQMQIQEKETTPPPFKRSLGRPQKPM